tara:strand:- start:107 stop:280 length:174 start_codon:yes stop_codon:yes gene_type:complete
MVPPTIFTQLWYGTKKGIQTKLKNKRQFDYENAHEALNELLSNDWRLIEYQINNASS